MKKDMRSYNAMVKSQKDILLVYGSADLHEVAGDGQVTAASCS